MGGYRTGNKDVIPVSRVPGQFWQNDSSGFQMFLL